MVAFDSVDLLAQFNEVLRRAASDEVTDATKYGYLARAQQEVLQEVAPIVPDAFYGAPAALSTSDNKVFTFGTANGSAIAPLGHVGIYPSLESIPDDPWVEGVDYLNEGTQIRIPNNATHSGTLYWRGITTPTDISASQAPALNPAPARRLIVLKAAISFCRAGARNPAVEDACASEYREALLRWLLNLKTQFRRGGGLSVSTRDLAILRGGGTP